MMSALFCVFVCFFGYAVAEKVIIIGAGAAGIATASKLLDQNITDFIILEAEKRIGGRVHSIHFGNAFVDLGAQFVYGEEGNLAYSLTKDYVVHDPEKDNISFYFDGKKKSGETLQMIGRKLYDELGEGARPTDSIGELYLTRYNTSVLSKYKDDPEMLRYAKRYLKIIQSALLSLDAAFDWFDICAKSNFREAEGDVDLSWNGLGFKTIFDILLRNFPNKTGYNIDNKLFLGKTATKIEIQDDSVRVECQDGSKYLSKHVVFTPSLGVLQNNHKEMFVPELKPEKVKALENLGFGGIMSIIVEFPNAWWQKDKRFIFVWNDKDIEDLKKDILFGPTANDDHWLTWFSYIGPAPNNPRVMIGWYSGPFVKEVEKLSETEIGTAILYTLNKHLGRDYNVTKPERVIHSKWCTNPNFRGTYSYETVEMRKKNLTQPFETLAEPIEGKDGIPRILFAGEATNSYRFGTVDGAIESGFRAGNKLVAFLK